MFDNICRFLAEKYSTDFATWLLGEPIQFTELQPSELLLDPIRTDSLVLLQSEPLLLHLEFQTDPDPKIPFRMTDYRIRGYRRYPHKAMRQVVIYLRPTNSPLVYQTEFSIGRLHHGYDVIRLWEQPTNIFLPGGVTLQR